ncbi:hypothetical protein GCM10010442_17590 [Kitasatospora kifunensis]
MCENAGTALALAPAATAELLGDRAALSAMALVMATAHSPARRDLERMKTPGGNEPGPVAGSGGGFGSPPHRWGGCGCDGGAGDARPGGGTHPPGFGAE